MLFSPFSYQDKHVLVQRMARLFRTSISVRIVRMPSTSDRVFIAGKKSVKEAGDHSGLAVNIGSPRVLSSCRYERCTKKR